VTTVASHAAGRNAVPAQARLVLAMSLLPDDVGKRIADAREEKGWSQLDLALVLDVSPSTVYRWEKGRLPGVRELTRLAAKLEKPLDYLMETPERQDELAVLGEKVEFLHTRQEELVATVERSVEILEALLERLPKPRRGRESPASP
jgi:transcriptional regulator with XRE-family HTH domain